MQASSQVTRQVRLALMLILGTASVAACMAAFMWWKAPSAQAATSPEAVFVTRCNFSHRSMDDPIVFFNQQGAAHSHDFFANRSTQFDSTYQKLRDPDVGTTCVNPDDKSAYWIPTVSWTNNSGTRELKASTAHFYYRSGGKPPEAVLPPPAGLKVVPNTHVTWRCAQNTAVSSSPPTRCSSGALVVAIRFPDCLAVARDPDTGQQILDQPLTDTADDLNRFPTNDHRSHMAYAVGQPNGTKLCPDTHPFPVAALTMEVKFKIGTASGTVSLSSDKGAPGGSTMHADFFNAWDQEKLTALVESCINAYPFSSGKPTTCKQV
jgi:Domain of unknown function (DUF1996)